MGLKVKEYKEAHFLGFMSIEKEFKSGQVDIGIQIAKDGRIWVCVNGEAFIRFKPLPHLPQEEE